MLHIMLHIVNKSPFEKNSLATCLRLAEDGSCILLIEDGIYGALRGTEWEHAVSDALKVNSMYALTPDLKARGIPTNRLIEGIQTVDYAGFVQLVADSAATQSWL